LQRILALTVMTWRNDHTSQPVMRSLGPAITNPSE
jgi:hypothetical protein